MEQKLQMMRVEQCEFTSNFKRFINAIQIHKDKFTIADKKALNAEEEKSENDGGETKSKR